MKYAVLGSNCFSASWLIALLLEDPSNYVVGVSRSPQKNQIYLPYQANNKNFDFFQYDLARQTNEIVWLLDGIKPDYIINYVALTEIYESIVSPIDYYEVNTLSTVKLCHELRQRRYLKFYIHISTAEVYGYCDAPAAEDAPLRPSTPYGASKAAADLHLMTLFHHFNFPVILIRSTNVYGKGQQLYRVIPKTVINSIKGRKIELHEGGTTVRAFIHIKDVAQGIIKAINKGNAGSIYNFSTERATPISELVKIICEQMGYNFKTSTISTWGKTGQNIQYLLDYSKAAGELGWTPTTPLEEGLNEVICWVKDNWEEISKEVSIYIHKV